MTAGRCDVMMTGAVCGVMCEISQVPAQYGKNWMSGANPIFSVLGRYETNFELTPRPRTVVGSHQSSLELL